LSLFLDSPRESRFRPALRSQLRVIGALMLRDALARFGRANLGLFWLLGEPLLLICGVITLWSITRQTHGTVAVVPFALSGYGMLTLFRHLVFRAVHAMRAHAGLIFHRHVKMFDILVARGVLEIIACLAAFVIAYLPLALMGAMSAMRDPLLFLAGWMLGGWFSLSFAMLLAAVTELSEAVERFVQPLMYFSIPLTGAFFMVDWLPPAGQAAVLWSPLVHVMEMLRAGLFPPDVKTHWSASYVVVWCLGQSAAALLLVHVAQARVRLR
jgi:capsular polysaccharide transport system permease protein